MIRPYSQPATPMLSRKPPRAPGTISPNRTSLVQSVAKVPMPMPPSATEVPIAMAYISHMMSARSAEQDTVRDELVDLIGDSQVLGAGLLLDGLVNNAVDVSVALVGDDALGIIVHFLLAVGDVGVDVV